jgi:hypothetical protein
MIQNEAAELTRERNRRAGREQRRKELDKAGSSRAGREYTRKQFS